MPYAAPMIGQDDPNKKNQDPTNISGGAGASFATGIPGQEASTGGVERQKTSGNYANIQSYLDANKDQGDGMGQKIATNITSKGDDASSKINTLSQKAPEVKAYDPNDVYNNLGSLTDDQKNTYRTQKTTGGYTGPDTVEKVDGYADTQKAATSTAQMAKNAGTEYGQQQLLRDTYARPSYSAGENRLDQALLQGSPNSKQAIASASSKYSDLDSLFNNAATNLGGSINNANSQSLANKQNIATAEQSQWNNLINPIQTRADQMNRDNPALINRVTQDASDEKLSDETLSLLGLSPGQKLYDMNLKNYINPNYTQLGLNEAANSQERSKYQALVDLVGDTSRNQITANGMEVKPVSFNKDQFDKDFAGKQAEMNNLLKNTNFTGRQQAEENGARYDWSADANVADYLARGSDSFHVNGGADHFTTDQGYRYDGDQVAANMKSQATQDAINQINAFLEQQKYNRVITKG